MTKAWMSSMQGSTQLSVFARNRCTGGLWATVLKNAIKAFNDLMKAKGVKPKLATTSKKPGGSGQNPEAPASALAEVQRSPAREQKPMDLGQPRR